VQIESAWGGIMQMLGYELETDSEQVPLPDFWYAGKVRN
jgi:hypothetical protein